MLVRISVRSANFASEVVGCESAKILSPAGAGSLRVRAVRAALLFLPSATDAIRQNSRLSTR